MPAGEYTIRRLEAGEYGVEFYAPWLGYETQVYNGKTDAAEADLVSVADGAAVAGIDAAMRRLAPPPPPAASAADGPDRDASSNNPSHRSSQEEVPQGVPAEEGPRQVSLCEAQEAPPAPAQASPARRRLRRPKRRRQVARGALAP
jgi:hypothetical protein